MVVTTTEGPTEAIQEVIAKEVADSSAEHLITTQYQIMDVKIRELEDARNRMNETVAQLLLTLQQYKEFIERVLEQFPDPKKKEQTKKKKSFLLKGIG